MSLDTILNQINGKARLIAVSKNVTQNEVISLYNQGLREFGENRVQELKRKSEILSNLDIKWHFIGRLQSNKINQLISFNEESKHRELLRLRHDIVETCNKAIKAGIVKNSQLLSIEELYETYKGLGGNHYVATLIERVETLDIDFDVRVDE